MPVYPDEKQPDIRITPNPFSTSTTIFTRNYFKKASLTLFNTIGQAVQQIDHIEGQSITLQRGHLPKGMYLARLTEDGTLIWTGRIIVTD